MERGWGAAAPQRCAHRHHTGCSGRVFTRSRAGESAEPVNLRECVTHARAALVVLLCGQSSYSFIRGGKGLVAFKAVMLGT